MKSLREDLARLGQSLRPSPASSPELERLARIAVSDYLERHLFASSKYREEGRLSRHEFQVYSQSGEDGIIEEIFQRIGASNRTFVEVGAGNGLTNNTAFRLASGWTGLWLEGSPTRAARIASTHEIAIAENRLKARHAVVTSENVESLLREAGVPEELDLLSIDIDGNDYWVWRSIASFRPRVVVIEYNASYPSYARWVKPYQADSRWDGSSFFGASLKSLELLGKEKGYSLVGCSFSGVNAFFVRDDCVAGHFCAPFNSENHYEPARYFLIQEPPFARSFASGVTR
jgi:hypothetical protein